MAANVAAAADTPQNRAQANHVIGIERWGQRRLRTALGEPLLRDKYDGYRPGDNMSMSALKEAFEATRTDTLQLVDDLRKANVLPTQTALHSDLGDLSLRGWLFYLDNHANREGMRVK